MSVVVILFEAIVVFILILYIVYLVCNTIDWFTFKKAYPQLKFKSFEKFYDLNPDRWDLYDHHVRCKITKKEYSSFYGYERASTTYEYFCFGYFDTFRYKHWFKCQNKKDKESQHFESKSKMLLMVKQDIADLEKRAEHEKDSALDILQQILNNKETTK